MRIAAIVAHGLALSVVLVACGASAPRPAPAASELPSGPPLSYLSPAATVIVRIDVARLRRSGMGEAFAAVAETSPDWSRMRGVLGFDPLGELDMLVIGCDSLSTERCALVLRHPHDDAHVRDRALAIATTASPAAAWREEAGLARLDWSFERVTGAYALFITASEELVLAPAQDLERVAAVSRDHAERRARGRAGALDPALTSGHDGELATIVIGTRLEVPGEGAPPAAEHMRLQVDEPPDRSLVVTLRGSFASPAEATEAGAWLERRRELLLQHPTVHFLGLRDALRATVVEVVGTDVAVRLQLAADRVGMLGGLLAWGLTRLVAPPAAP